MPKVSQMQGTPAQLEYLKSDGKRRYPTRCLYFKGKRGTGVCQCNKNVSNYSLLCHSASKCDYYKEK